MSDKPMLFSAPMVLALLDGRKTQTRRVIKPQPAPNVTGCGRFADSLVGLKDQWEWLSGDQTDIDDVCAEGAFKTGVLEGDRLWVREAVHYATVGGLWCFDADNVGIGVEGCLAVRHFKRDKAPAMFLPRVASRLTLTVTDVRVQRLQDISKEDCIAEGIPREDPWCPGVKDERDQYCDLWNSLHGAQAAWACNPWLAALTFTVARANIDAETPVAEVAR